jgi:lipoprotein-releasing system permease protein
MSLDTGRAAPFGPWERIVAARYLRAKRGEGGVALISLISFIGITLAVAALIIVMSVMNGFRSELLSRMLGFNGHMFVAGGVLASPEREAAVTRIARVPGVTQVTSVLEGQVLALGPGLTTGAIVRGITPKDLAATKIVSQNITRGSMKGFGKGEYGGNTILVGDRLARSLGVRPGDPLTLVSPSGAATPFGSTPREVTYIVGGTFTVGMSELDQAFLFMPLEQAQLLFGREGIVDVIEIRLDDPDKAMGLKAAVANAAGPTAVVTDWTQRNAAYWGALKVERNVMRLILMLLVAIAAMNIISGLVMLVKNKGRDIAILRTMGAGQGAILRIFVMAGGSIGVLGTAAGFAIGAVFCIFIEEIQMLVEKITGQAVFSSDVYFLSHIPAEVDWKEVAIIVSFSLAASLLATLPPASRASRLDPVEALRYE